MPGGKCSASGAFGDTGSAVRCAEVVVSFGAVRRTLFLGGVAQADFPTLKEGDLQNLGGGQSFAVRWQAAVFHGADTLLGDVTAVLRPSEGAPSPSSGMVSSLASPIAPHDVGFFPARNTNSFMWRFLVPRLGLVFDSNTALQNEAEINAIPPFGSVYELVHPVRFRSVRARGGWLAGVLGASPTGSPSVTVESCRVKLMELKHLRVDLQKQWEGEHSVTFAVTVVNESTEDRVRATWMIWPPPEEGADRARGTLSLGRSPRSARFTVPRDVFYRPRVLAVSIAEPFETDAAQAATFPALG